MSTYNDFVRRLEEIRRLSTPSMKGIPDAEQYSEKLKSNFTRIGELARQNRVFLNSVFFPVIRSDKPLSSDESSALMSFGEELLSAFDVENLDLALMAIVSERLLNDAEMKKDFLLTIQRLDVRMDTCYALMTMIGRTHVHLEVPDRYRQEGLRIGHFFLDLLDHDKFENLLDETSREIILTDVRYMSVFYEGLTADNPLQQAHKPLLDRVLALAEDPFYHRLAPHFNWRYFRYRALNYYSKLTDLCNSVGYDREALETICERTEAYVRLWQSDPEYYRQFDNERQVQMLLYRNRYLAGKMDVEDYHDKLIDLYNQRESERYDLNGIYENLQIPAEVICLYDPEHLSQAQMERLDVFYRDMILYAYRMPNENSLSSLLEFYISIIDRFIDIPGGIPFETMVLNCLAALHPPTYIHSVMVGRIASCLCRRLVDVDPGQLVGILGCQSVEDVRRQREALCDFVCHAGFCHDFGKLAIIDTIFIYGRNLFDMEFDLIQTHPLIGQKMLAAHASTRAYADVAAGHHIWYDNSRGYPREINTANSPIKPIIDLVLCADCMDAATDSIGRSYKAGKTFDAFLEEIEPELGAHYAPWLWPLLTESRAEIQTLLTEGRRETYRDTYYLLRSMTGI